MLAVDSSCIMTGFILSQLGMDDKQYPSQFWSITWNEWELHYSQAKIEIYGLWHAFRLTSFTSFVSKTFRWKLTQVISKECSTIWIFSQVQKSAGGLLASSSSNLI